MLQLARYADEIAHVQGRLPAPAHVLGTTDVETLRPANVQAYLGIAQRRLRDHVEESPETYPWPCEHCSRCDLAAVVGQLERVIADGEPQKTKALLRLLIQELRVDGRAQIQPTYRLVTPTVCATSEKVERTGIEPVTSGLQSRRSPS